MTFLFKSSVKEITLSDGCVVEKTTLLGNYKQNNVGQILLFQLPTVAIQNHAILLAGECVI